jgi:protein-S-isoprenylcysteine O-methyltransferase Ste14
MDEISYHIIIGCWIAFFVYWFISAATVKAASERQDFLSSLAYRIPVLFGAVLIWNPHLHHPLNAVLTPHTFWTPPVGAFICLCGLFVAIWARRTIAGNWSSNITFKQGHELVKTGPYRFVRHPIYTGILLLGLGSAVGSGQLRFWLGLLFWFIGFWIKLKQEERLMLQHFPDQYPAYRQQVKALVPFVI